jgi:hypothetical protein
MEGDADPVWKKFESGDGKLRIRDKHPGSQHLGTIIWINKTEVRNPDPDTMVLKRQSSCSENKLRKKRGK